MIGFWIAVGLLLTGALLFVVPPLLSDRRRQHARASHDEANVSIYRDQLAELDADLEAGTIAEAQHRVARAEIEKRLLEEVGIDPSTATVTKGNRLVAVLVGMSVPVLALALYGVLGNPAGLDPSKVAAVAQGQSHALTPEQIVDMVEKLSDRLKQNPDDVEGWVMLARTYAALQRYQEAAQAYANVVKRIPNDAQLLADYADSLAMAQGKTLMGEPEKLIARALSADPRNVKALALAGSAAFEKKDYAAAARHWQNILALVPPESELARSVKGSIAEARSLGGMVAQAPAAAQPAAAVGARLSGTVSLDPKLAAKAAPGDTLFVFARAASGPRVPLAVQRLQVKDLPASFVLDDTMSMAPEMKLSKFSQVVVGARISKTGTATPQPGDLQGLTQPVVVGASGLAVTIDTEVR